jgi:tetratricopeptide (TPR) repeat protein
MRLTIRSCACAAVVGLSLVYPQARFVLPEIALVPVARIIQNLEKRASQNAADVESRLNLARAYGMAFALNANTVPVAKGVEPTEVWFGPAPTHVPFAAVSRTGQIGPDIARTYLARAIARYQEVIALDPKHLAARLGLAWCLEQSGERSQAIDGYRRVIRDAWQTESALTADAVRARGIRWQSITVEAGEYLKPLLDPVRDKAEIESIEQQSDQIARLPRWITPIVIPLHDGVTADDLVDPAAQVMFDADGTGWKKRWTWTTRDAGWLVHLPQPDVPVTSALQMFGSVTFWMFWAQRVSRPARA